MWFGFLIYVAFAFFITSTLWTYCGALSRKKPIILLLVGFLVSICGIFLIWATESYSATIVLICNKFSIIPPSECQIDKALGGITVKFIEIGFAALGAGLMGLAFDIKTKDDLDLRIKTVREKLGKLKQREVQWQQNFDQLEKDLDTLQPSEKVKRFNHLRNIQLSIFDEKLNAEDEVAIWV